MAILIDTGVFYALFDKGDAHHVDAVAIMAHILEGRFGRAYTTDYVVLETTLLLRARLGAETVKALVGFLNKSGIAVLVVDEPIFERAVKLLTKMPERLSLCDAASLVLIDELGIETLASFNLRSFADLVANIVGREYYASLGSEEKRRIQQQYLLYHPSTRYKRTKAQQKLKG